MIKTHGLTHISLAVADHTAQAALCREDLGHGDRA